MKQYALRIRKSDLDLLTDLNNGVTPQIEKKPTWLVISVGPDAIPNQIVDGEQLQELAWHGFNQKGAVLLTLNK